MKNFFKILLIGIVTLGLMLTASSCGPSDLEIHMFTNLSECRAIESQQLTDVQVTVYNSPENDKYIEDLMYVDYYACNYSSKELQLDLFAYEFSDQEIAQAYFENATGKDPSKAVTFSDSQGLTTYRRVVIKDNLAYSVSTRASDADAVKEIINQFFSEKIIVVEW